MMSHDVHELIACDAPARIRLTSPFFTNTLSHPTSSHPFTLHSTCPAGKHSKQWPPAGQSYTTVGAKEARKCRMCPNGHYQPKPGQQKCMKCPVGQTAVVIMTAGLNCGTICDMGKFSTDDGMSWDEKSPCKSCPGGKYTSIVQSTGCQTCTCPSGKFQQNRQYCACVPCPAGKYQEWDLHTTCTACPKNKFQGKPGAEVCSDCKSGRSVP